MQQQRLPCWKEQMRPPLSRYIILCYYYYFFEFKKPSLALYVWAGREVLWRFSVTTNCDWFIAHLTLNEMETGNVYFIW